MKILSKGKLWLIWGVLFLLVLPLSWYCRSNETPKEPNSAVAAKQDGTASEVGKIWGQVIDMTSGEPLPGANVLLSGTTNGAATDMNGQYYILNVPPGAYTLQCSFIGYGSVQHKDVKVSVGHSTKIDFKLEPAAIMAEKLYVTANKTNDSETDSQIFVAYDEPPMPIGGWGVVGARDSPSSSTRGCRCRRLRPCAGRCAQNR